MGERVFTEQDRQRLGNLKSRVDLTLEERDEMAVLDHRFLEDAVGGIWGDFVLVEDSGGGGLFIPCSEAAKNAYSNRIAARDRDQFRAILKDLEGRGFTIQRKKTS